MFLTITRAFDLVVGVTYAESNSLHLVNSAYTKRIQCSVTVHLLRCPVYQFIPSRYRIEVHD